MLDKVAGDSTGGGGDGSDPPMFSRVPYPRLPPPAPQALYSPLLNAQPIHALILQNKRVTFRFWGLFKKRKTAVKAPQYLGCPKSSPRVCRSSSWRRGRREAAWRVLSSGHRGKFFPEKQRHILQIKAIKSQFVCKGSDL